MRVRSGVKTARGCRWGLEGSVTWEDRKALHHEQRLLLPRADLLERFL